MDFLHQRSGLSDEGLEDAIYDSRTVRGVAMKRGRRKAMAKKALKELIRRAE